MTFLLVVSSFGGFVGVAHGQETAEGTPTVCESPAHRDALMAEVDALGVERLAVAEAAGQELERHRTVMEGLNPGEEGDWDAIRAEGVRHARAMKPYTERLAAIQQRMTAVALALRGCPATTDDRSPTRPPTVVDLSTLDPNELTPSQRAAYDDYRAKQAALEAHEEEIVNLTRASDMLDLTTCTYDDRPCTLPEGWSKVSETDPQLIAFDLHPRSGVHMEVFRNDETGEVVLGVRGSFGARKVFSNPIQWWTDWVSTNIKQGLGADTRQYNDVMDAARLLKEVYGDQFTTVVGHSKGGGQAAAAATAFGLDAFTYDAAGLHPKTVPRYLESRGLDGPATTGTIVNYRAFDDPLTERQETGLLGRLAPDAVGEQLTVEATDPTLDGEIGHSESRLNQELRYRLLNMELQRATLQNEMLTTESELLSTLRSE
ncbi:hypothetical protein [Salinigranum sp.]|uniref:hypothetical protein n=1 Tax=Salinigranum sp. TaxID=1966351 RepID=UPI00356A41E6